MRARGFQRGILFSGVGLSVTLAGGAQGLSKVNTLLQNVLTLLQGVSAVIVAIAVIVVGYKMIFHHAKWSEVSNVVIGALFIGAASSIASWLLG
jgi:type IV secretion system protein VirB2